ncbi:hypothetical protein MLD38_031365 [Melastoma candidum]|uniref:Uncharacterized protein n=1 Tax=Melastoma candidum TaxID=119954 RepID=A0ACB9MNU7_9MYRT|nr:hypothetical protein MLD38_031365 [Melastoma candidum]
MGVGLGDDVVIVGGGISGLATALALHRKGIRSVVLERSKVLRATGGAITIKANGWIALDYLGVILRKNSLQVKGYTFIDLDKGTRSTEPTRMEEGEIRTIKRGDLVVALANELPPGTIRYGSHVCRIEPNGGGAILELSNGISLKAKVLIGCDGTNSVVSRYLGMKPPTFSTTVVMRGLAHYPEGHGYEHVFAVYKKGRVTLGRNPLDDKVVYWEIMQKWTPQFSEISRSQDLIKVASLEALKCFPDEMSDMINKLIPGSMNCTRFGYHGPWDILLGRFRRDAVTVAGDALHASSPFLGQGGSMGLEDAVVIARCIHRKLSEACPSPEAYEAALSHYVNERRARLVWLLVEANLMINMKMTSPPMLRIASRVVKSLLFRDPMGNARFDCGPF